LFFFPFGFCNKKEPLHEAVHRNSNTKNRLRFCFDSASQNFVVTVRQIFSDDPAWKTKGIFLTSAVSPFPNDGRLALPKGTDEARASI